MMSVIYLVWSKTINVTPVDELKYLLSVRKSSGQLQSGVPMPIVLAYSPGDGGRLRCRRS